MMLSGDLCCQCGVSFSEAYYKNIKRYNDGDSPDLPIHCADCAREAKELVMSEKDIMGFFRFGAALDAYHLKIKNINKALKKKLKNS